MYISRHSSRAILATLLLVCATTFAQSPQPPTVTYNTDISYGGTGLLHAITYPSGKVLTYQYDITGQLTGLLWNGQPLISNLIWTPLGQPKSWNWAFVSGNPAGTRTYNTAGQLTDNGVTAYIWDAAARVSQITQYLFGPAGTAGGSATPITITTTVTYDSAGRITQVTHADANAELPSGTLLQDIIGPLSASYQYDANGNRSQTNYSQYAGSGGINSLTRTFTLNAANNRVEGVKDSHTQSNGSTLTETRVLQWDASGHLTNDGKLTFEYDPRGRIDKIVNSENATTTTYLTNALGQRVRKVENITQVTDTVYGDEELGLESYPLGNYTPSSNGTITNSAEYIYLPTSSGPMPIAAQIGEALYAIDSDHLNTPRRLTDANGQPVWQWIITAFGELEPTTAHTGFTISRLNTGTPPIANTQSVVFNLRYPGQQHDEETGLYYNHHRTYDPYLTIGYTQPDPLGLEVGWNRFSYADGNPLSYTDPEGLLSTAACANPANAAACAAAGMAARGSASLSRPAPIPVPMPVPIPKERVWCGDDDGDDAPCNPPEGTKCYDNADYGRPHAGLSPHYHIYQMQKTRPDGTCYWRKLAGKVGVGVFELPPVGINPCSSYPNFSR
ncbi:MAG: hypothetical protein LBU76_01110 [Azoarcus sp.]|jgi:RHS repeat-associated protein|nr:hypothetical protein [Azoarcus sp.]